MLKINSEAKKEWPGVSRKNKYTILVNRKHYTEIQTRPEHKY